jgi:RNase P protein component
VTVPKRAFSGAVQRNRVKRVLQAGIAVAESMPAGEKTGYDVAVWMKKATREPFEDHKTDLLRELEALLAKIGTKRR